MIFVGTVLVLWFTLGSLTVVVILSLIVQERRVSFHLFSLYLLSVFLFPLSQVSVIYVSFVIASKNQLLVLMTVSDFLLSFCLGGGGRLLAACGILALRPGTEAVSRTRKARGSDQWTAREPSRFCSSLFLNLHSNLCYFCFFGV